jgi:hypothetical protein
MDHGSGHSDGAHGGQGGHITKESLFIASLGTHSGGHFSFAYNGGSGGNHDHPLAVHTAISPQGNSVTSLVDVNVPTTDENGEAIRGYICHISKHGRLDILTEFKKLAARYDLIQIDGRRPGLDISDRIKYQILDFDAWAHAQELAEGRPYDAATFGDRAKPNGWYPGATGSTALIRQYWQVGKRKRFLGKPEFDDQAGTYLEVSVIIWSYYESGDFETKLEVRVISAPEWSEHEQKWGYRGVPFATHQRVAIKSYTAMMDLLIATKPGLTAELLRGELDAKYPPQAEVPEGTYAMSEAEILERDAESLNDDARDDQVSRDNQPGLPAATPPASDGGDDGDTADLTVELDD